MNSAINKTFYTCSTESLFLRYKNIFKKAVGTFSKKAFLSSSVWPRRENTQNLNRKQSLLICFENCQDVPYSHE